MRKSRFNEEQKVKMVRESEQKPVAEVAKKHGVSVETLYRWRRAYRRKSGGRHPANMCALALSGAPPRISRRR
jgi:putative transposase